MPAPLGIDVSPTFTKFRSSMTGADTNLTLPAGRFDWEVERVAVIGRFAHKVPIDTAGDYVGGLTIGQDSSLSSPLPSGVVVYDTQLTDSRQRDARYGSREGDDAR